MDNPKLELDIYDELRPFLRTLELAERSLRVRRFGTIADEVRTAIDLLKGRAAIAILNHCGIKLTNHEHSPCFGQGPIPSSLTVEFAFDERSLESLQRLKEQGIAPPFPLSSVEGAKPKCPRCGIGYDTNGDGDCGHCHALSDEFLAEILGKAGVEVEREEFEQVFGKMPNSLLDVTKWNGQWEGWQAARASREPK